MAVVDVVGRQVDEVTAALFRHSAAGLPGAGEDRAEARGVTSQTDVAGRRVDEQVAVAVGAVRVNGVAILAVVHGVADVAAGDGSGVHPGVDAMDIMTDRADLRVRQSGHAERVKRHPDPDSGHGPDSSTTGSLHPSV